MDFPLFNKDGSPKVNGEIRMHLMDGFFNTQEKLTSNLEGVVDNHGYFGSYELEMKVDGSTYTGSFNIENGKDNPLIEVTLVSPR